MAAATLVLLCGCGGSSATSGAAGGGSAESGSSGSAPVDAASGCALAAWPSAAWTQCEAANLTVNQQNTVPDLALAPAVAQATAQYQAARLQLLATDPERQPNPNPCTTLVLCPIDPRLAQWVAHGGLVQPVLFASRSGGTLSGHVWATRNGPARRPGVVIINGSIVGFEQIYWFAAQALAQAGFVVLTFDAQGEGMSDQFGETPDQNEDAFAGTPILGLLGPTPPQGTGLGGNGLPFYDGGADALDFFLSTPAHPYLPVASRSSGTSHAAKQQRRAAAGLNSAYNPLWNLLDPGAIGLAGHSYGAVASSWLAQQDPRVSAAVAWDSLCVPVWPSPDEGIAFATAPVNTLGGVLPAPLLYGFSPDCFAAPAGPAPPITKPALGLNGDYLLVPAPYVAPPRPQDKAAASLAYSAAGVDSGNITIRGAVHTDFNDVPVSGVPASLRGADVLAWYTVAWFAKYLQHDPRADRLLLTARWRNDAAGAAASPAGDANLYSWHYRSRLDIGLAGGGRFACENLRDGCPGQYAAAQDCGAATYSYVAVDTAPAAAAPAACQVP
jgi:dienelactone hydrolase